MANKEIISVALHIDFEDELNALENRIKKVMSNVDSDTSKKLGDGLKDIESEIDSVRKSTEKLNKEQSNSSGFEKIVESLQSQIKTLADQLNNLEKTVKDIQTAASQKEDLKKLQESVNNLSSSVNTAAESVNNLNKASESSTSSKLSEELRSTKDEAKETSAALDEVARKAKVYKNQTNSTTSRKGKKVQTLNWTEYTDFFQTVTKNAAVQKDGSLTLTSEKIRTNYEALEKEITKVDKKIIDLLFDMGRQDDAASKSTQNQIDLLREYLQLLTQTRNTQINSPGYLVDTGHAQKIDFVRNQVQVGQYSEKLTALSKEIDKIRNKIADINRAGLSKDYIDDLDKADTELVTLSNDLQDLFNKIKSGNFTENDILSFLKNYKDVFSSIDDVLDFRKIDKQLDNVFKKLAKLRIELYSSPEKSSMIRNQIDELEILEKELLKTRAAQATSAGQNVSEFTSKAAINQYTESLKKIQDVLTKTKKKIEDINQEGLSQDYIDDLIKAKSYLDGLDASLDALFSFIKSGSASISDIELFFTSFDTLKSVVDSTINFEKIDKEITKLKNDIIEIDTAIASAGADTDTAGLEKKKELIQETIDKLVDERNKELQLSGSAQKAYDNADASIAKYNEEIINTTSSLDKMREKLSSFVADSSRSAYFKQEASVLRESIGEAQEELLDSYDLLKTNPFDGKNIDAYNIALKKVISLIKEYNDLLANSTTSSSYEATREDVQKLDNQISAFLDQNTAAANRFKKALLSIQTVLRNTLSSDASMSKFDLSYYTEQVNKIQSEVKSLHQTGNSFFTSLRKQLQSANAQFIGTYFSIQDLIRYGKEIFDTVTEIDSALTELRKVSDATSQRLVQNFENSAKAAKDLGASVSDVINVTADWSRLGYSVDEAEELARVTTLFKNVGDDMDAATASEYMISALQGFQMSADEAERIVDAYNEVANNYAIDTAGIGEALERSAASFNAANTSMEKAIALVTATNEVVQNPEAVGTLWKTMSARIRGASTELAELGEEEDEFTQTTSKLQALVKGLTGFDIMEDENTFKDIYDIIVGISKEWDNLTDIEQASLGEALAGKRNANALFAVIGNLETLEAAYESASNSAGSAAKEQENYSKSIQYSLDRLAATFEILSVDLLDSDFAKGLVEFLVTVVELIDELVEHIGVLVPLLTAIGGFSIFKNINNIKGLSDLGKTLAVMGEAEKAVNALMTAGSTAADAYAAGVAALTAEQSAELLVNQGLNTTLIEQALIKKGLSDTRAKEIVQTAVMNKQLTAQTAGTFSLSAAYKGLAASIGLSTKAFTAILGVGALVVAAIGIGIAAWDHYTISTEEATEALANFKEESDTLKSNLESHKQLVRDVADRYEELAQGVDTLTNKNLTLSDDDYKEFLDITTQLGEAFPELIKSSDEYGGYILTIGDNYKYAAEELRNYLDEEEKRYYYSQYKNLGDISENSQVLLDSYKEDIERAEYEKDLVDDRIKAVALLKETIEEYKNATESINLNEIFSNAGISNTARNDVLSAFRDYGLDDIISLRDEGTLNNWTLDLSEVNEENQQAIDDYFNSIVVEYESDLSGAIQELNNANAQYESEWMLLRQAISDALMFQLSGDDISDSTRQLAQQYASSLTSEVVDSFADESGKVDYQKLVNNFASEFKNLDLNEQIEFTKLFNPELSPEEKIAVYNNLQSIFDEKGIKIPLEFIIEDEEDVVNRVKEAYGKLTGTGSSKSFVSIGAQALQRSVARARGEEVLPTYEELFDEIGADTVEEYNKILQIINGCKTWEEAVQKVRDAYASASQELDSFDYSPLDDAISDVNEKLLPQFQELGTLYDEIFNGDGFDLSGIGASDLQGVIDTFKNLDEALEINPPTEAIDQFIRVISNSSSTAGQVQESFNALATAYFNAAVEAGNFSEENAAVLEQMLTEMGIVNASEVVDYYEQVAEAKKLAADNGKDLANMTAAEIEQFAQEVGASEETANALYILALKKIFLNENWVNEETSVEQVLALAKAAGIATEAVTKLANVQAQISGIKANIANELKSGNPNTTNISDWEAQLAGLEQSAADYAKQIEEDINNVTVDIEFSVPKTSSGGGSSASEAGKEAGEEAADEYVEAFEEELEALEKQRDQGIISEKEFLEKYKNLIDRYFKDIDGYAEEYADRMHDYFDRLTSYYENVFSAIGTILSRRISALENAKSAAVDSINAEKEAAEASYQAQIDYIDDLIDAKEAEIDAIDDEIEKYQDQIDAIDKQIDALEEANQKRQQAINLQKAQYDLERAQQQRTKLIYKGGQLVYENDTSAVRDARENLEDAEFEIQKQKLEDLKKPLEEQIELLEKRKELIQDEIDGLEKQQDAIQKAMEASNKYYDQMIKETEAYWDALIEKLEDTKSKFEEIAELKNLAEAIDTINSYLGETKYTVEDVYNGTPELIDQMLQDYINALMGANSYNEDFANSLATAAQEMGLSFGQIAQDADDTKGKLGSLADAITPLTQATFEIGNTADALSKVADNSDKVATSTGTASTNTESLSKSLGTIASDAPNAAQGMEATAQSIEHEGVAAENAAPHKERLATANEKLGQVSATVATNVEAAAKAIGDEGTNAESAYTSLNNIANLNLASIVTQTNLLADAIGEVAAALGLTEGNPISALQTALSNLATISLGDESTGIIGSFNQLKTAVNGVTSAIGGGGGGDSEGGDGTTDKSASMSEGANDGGSGGLISAIGELHAATDTHIGTSAEGGGEEEGGTVISDFNALKEAVMHVAEAVGIPGENGEIAEESLLGVIQTMPEESEEPINTVQEYFLGLAAAINSCVSAVGELLDAIGELSGSIGSGGLSFSLSGGGIATGNVHVAEATGNVHAGNAYSSGKLGLKKNETALVGEVGQELVYNPKSGTYRTVGDNGPEITRLQKGDLIFNAEQTKAIIKNGKRDHGRSYADGNTGFMPLTDEEMSLFTKIGSAVADMQMDIRQMLDPVKSMAQNVTRNTTNIAPVINITDTKFEVSGVTGEEVTRQISDTFSGIISNAYQRAMKR